MASGKTTSSASHSRTALVVLGMHRSGTSLMTRLLSLLGADLPQNLMDPSNNNPTGYWESRKVREFNDKLLSLIGSRWDDWRALPEGWEASHKAKSLVTEAEDLLANEFGSSPFLVLKDPRISVLMPFWSASLSRAGLDFRPILALRNPLEVAASLEQRNGFPTELSYLLWLRYMLQAEASTRGMARAVLSYDDVMKNWAGAIDRLTGDLDLKWLKGVAQISNQANALISSKYRHHKFDAASLDSPLISRWLRETFDILKNWSQKGEREEDYGKLDAIAADLNNAAPAFAPLLDEMLAVKAELAKKKQVIQANRDRIKELVNAERKAQAELEQFVLHQEEGITLQDRVMQKLQEEIELESQRADQAEEKYRTRERSKTKAQTKKLRKQIADSESELSKSQSEVSKSSEALRQVETAFERQTLELAETQHILTMAETSVAQKDAELADTRKELSDSSKAVTGLRKALDQSRQYAMTLEWINESLKREADLEHAHVQTLTQQNAHLLNDQARAKEAAVRTQAEHEKNIGKLRSELAVTKSNVGTRHSELAQMTNLLMQAEAKLQQAEGARIAAEACQADLNVILAVLMPLRRSRRFWQSKETRLQREIEAVRRTGLFDADWYLRTNSDVKEAGMDALKHYVLFGLAEGRPPRDPIPDSGIHDHNLISTNDFSGTQK